MADIQRDSNGRFMKGNVPASKGIGLYSKYNLKQYRFVCVWKSMISRCMNVKNKSYPLYGGRGITVCQRWQNFDNFKKDLFRTFKVSRHRISLDRIDNNGNYEPKNIRWATYKEQANNRRSNHVITYNGLTMNIGEWSVYLGIKRTTLSNRQYYKKLTDSELINSFIK